jgi:hypothetical protein
VLLPYSRFSDSKAALSVPRSRRSRWYALSTGVSAPDSFPLTLFVARSRADLEHVVQAAGRLCRYRHAVSLRLCF